MTVVPYCANLLKMDLMSKADIAYINEYHARCLKLVAPVLKEKGWELGYQWLEANSKPI
jgi:hypothetical protein